MINGRINRRKKTHAQCNLSCSNTLLKAEICTPVSQQYMVSGVCRKWGIQFSLVEAGTEISEMFTLEGKGKSPMCVFFAVVQFVLQLCHLFCSCCWNKGTDIVQIVDVHSLANTPSSQTHGHFARQRLATATSLDEEVEFTFGWCLNKNYGLQVSNF